MNKTKKLVNYAEIHEMTGRNREEEEEGEGWPKGKGGKPPVGLLAQGVVERN